MPFVNLNYLNGERMAASNTSLICTWLLHFASSLVFFPTLHRPLPPLFPDALSALVCVWAATVRGHCLPCLTRGAQCVCVKEKDRSQLLDNYMNESVRTWRGVVGGRIVDVCEFISVWVPFPQCVSQSVWVCTLVCVCMCVCLAKLSARSL